jgi:hypothetical protein
MVTTNNKMPRNKLLTNPITDWKSVKVEKPTIPMQSTAMAKRALLNVGRKNIDA